MKWERIHFYIGIPWPYSRGDEEAITLPGGNSQIGIYIAPDQYQPCTIDFVVRIAHELVHALQIQSSMFDGKGLGRFHMFTIKYLSCWSRQWQHPNNQNDDKHPYEKEAYEYEDRLRAALTAEAAPNQLPCTCGAFGQVTENAAFVGVDALEEKKGHIVKRRARQTTPCRGQFGRIGTGLVWDGTAGAPLYNVLGWALAGAIVGAFIAGGPAGAIGGFFGGAVLGALDELTGVPSFLTSVAVALTGAFLNLTVSLANAVSEFFGGPGDRPLKIAFSLDEGQTFGEPSVLGVTSEPPAAAFSPADLLYVSWKSPDGQFSFLNLSSGGGAPTLTSLGNAEGNSGPALAWGDNRLLLLWQRESNKLYVRTSATNAASFTERVQFGGKVPSDATPGIAYGNGRAFAAWIRKKNNKIGMKSSVNSGGTWTNETTFSFGSHDDGTAAVTFSAGLLFLARATSDERRVRVASLGINASGDVWVAQDFDLGVRCCDHTGPAIAAGNGRVFVAWIGREEQHPRLRVYRFAADGVLTMQSETVLANERSKDNAGPALAYTERMGGRAGISVLALAWVRKNT